MSIIFLPCFYISSCVKSPYFPVNTANVLCFDICWWMVMRCSLVLTLLIVTKLVVFATCDCYCGDTNRLPAVVCGVYALYALLLSINCCKLFGIGDVVLYINVCIHSCILLLIQSKVYYKQKGHQITPVYL